MLEKIKGLDGVPTLITAWTVQTSEGDETTDLIWPRFLVQNATFETRIHQRLLLTPEGQPLLSFSSLCELLSIFINIIDVHFVLVHVYGILHRDISFHNILMYTCNVPQKATSEDEKKREAIIKEHGYRRGLLIDFDYADMVSAGKQGVSSGDHTGTIPFMSIGILQEYASPTPNFVHTFAHDLESLIYIHVWVCVLYQAPQEVHKDWNIDQTCLKQWASAKTLNDIGNLHDLKLGQLLSKTVVSDFMPYFEQMKPVVSKLYGLILNSHLPDSAQPFCHVDVKQVLLEAFMTVEEESCGAENMK
ncbi:hypothetical protein BU15DRAFT_54342 [Melanogaster broomeanus]|nr:hypothetical protein BU15DRAFT_54342 [Melanogaster broomeanus]